MLLHWPEVRGKAGVGVSRLHQWCIDADKCETPTERLLALAPQKQGQPVIKPTRMEWLPDFMAVYRNTNGLYLCLGFGFCFCILSWWLPFPCLSLGVVGLDPLPCRLLA